MCIYNSKGTVCSENYKTERVKNEKRTKDFRGSFFGSSGFVAYCLRRGFEFFFRTVEQFFVIFGTIEQYIKHNNFIVNGAVKQFLRRGEQQCFVVFGTVEQQFKQLVKFCGRRQYIKRAR